MNIVRRFILIFLACVLVGCASSPNATTASSPNATTSAPVAQGAAAPPLRLPTLDNSQMVDLESLRGSVVLVNFWASWCEPCKREMPLLQHWHEQYKDAGLVVLGVDTLYQDDRAAAQAFVQANNITYPILMDQAGDTQQPWLIQGLPRTYIIDRDGRVHALHLGEFKQADFDAQVAPLLNK